MEDAAPTQEAWEQFCDELKRAGAVLRRKAPATDGLTLAEGYRHLVRMIRAGFEVAGEFGDPRHPELFPMATRTMLSEGVTSDARYHQAFIDGAAPHRITGDRGTAPLIEIGVYTGRRGFHPTSELTACLTERELVVEPDGRFAVTLGPDERPGNWIRTDGGTRYLFIRQYAHDWSTTRSATFHLRREDASGPRPPLALGEVRSALERTAAFVQHAPAFWADISDYWSERAVNRIVPQEDADAKTNITVPSGHRFACGYFRLEADQALVVTFRPSETPYWGLHLDNYWYETLSWGDTRSQLNNRTATYEADGAVRVVISERKPGAGAGSFNWLETQGHRQGSIVFRLSRSDAAMPGFATQLVDVAELGAA